MLIYCYDSRAPAQVLSGTRWVMSTWWKNEYPGCFPGARSSKTPEVKQNLNACISVLRKNEEEGIGEQGLDSGPGAWATGGQESKGHRGWAEKGSSGSHTPGANSGCPEQELGPSRKKAPQSILTRWHWARTGPSVLRPQCCHSKHKMMWPSGLTLTELATQQQPLRVCYVSDTLGRAQDMLRACWAPCGQSAGKLAL